MYRRLSTRPEDHLVDQKEGDLFGGKKKDVKHCVLCPCGKRVTMRGCTARSCHDQSPQVSSFGLQEKPKLEISTLMRKG